MEFVGERFEIEPNFGTTRENVFEDNTYYRKWYGEAYLPFAIANALKSKRFKLFSHVAKRLVGGVLSATVGYTGVSPLTKKRIREATSSMNQDLSRIIGMDLSKYGYY